MKHPSSAAYKKLLKGSLSFLLGLVSSSATGVFCRMVENGFISARFKIKGNVNLGAPGRKEKRNSKQQQTPERRSPR